MCISLIAHCAQNISLEVFKATEFNKIRGRQLHQDVNSHTRVGGSVKTQLSYDRDLLV